MAIEILNRIANILFGEWCENFDVPELKAHYEKLLDAAHAALDALDAKENNEPENSNQANL